MSEHKLCEAYAEFVRWNQAITDWTFRPNVQIMDNKRTASFDFGDEEISAVEVGVL